MTLSENMKLEAFPEDQTAEEEALRYPRFLLRTDDGCVQGTKETEDRIMPPPSIKQVQMFQCVIDETFHGINKSYTNIEWISSKLILAKSASTDH